ncbi:MAG TPA: hydroxylamine reductase [Treponema sp.]|uniref:hydroxylamine reductase n=1 Tax=Gracilinema caldarium TaxID=215591 RepID=UPI0026EA2076|nr:hydroxylamine reductase [Gracilinema caldarium]HON13127.1 hydroxylamine reductase [Treponema sp.]HRS03437.1 hydroxylamine reductase [Treponema sp.]
MSMFCHQCQEAARGTGCTVKGVCGKDETVSNLQDVLLFALKGLAFVSQEARRAGISNPQVSTALVEGLFATITNANFDKAVFIARIRDAITLREELKKELSLRGVSLQGYGKHNLHPSVTFAATTEDEMLSAWTMASFLAIEDPDVRALRSLVIFGLKGMAAYMEHAINLGKTSDEVLNFIERALAATIDDSLDGNQLTALVLETGKYGVDAMALLDGANTSTYGDPEPTTVQLGVRKNPGILISGHDLKDLEELLEQTQGTGVDVYTHGEMLPAHYYPAFKKYPNFVGNYGNAWWKQVEEFEAFNGPILLTTNCLVPPKESYKHRVFTTGEAGFPGCIHIADRKEGGKKDFSALIALAKTCPSPTPLEEGTLVGGFAHAAVENVAPAVVDAVQKGAIKRFFVMAGCDGRQKGREYYTEFAEALPKDTVILTAGCAKYRYNKLNLGDIGGIPRVLDAGQCNDSYSLALTALKLKEAFGASDVNDLPISFNIAWYEQKAVIVLLALLYLGFKNIHLGPTLPAFLSPNVAKVLVENFGIAGIGTVREDVKLFMGA